MAIYSVQRSQDLDFFSTQLSSIRGNSGVNSCVNSVSTYDLRTDIPCILSGQWQKKSMSHISGITGSSTPNLQGYVKVAAQTASTKSFFVEFWACLYSCEKCPTPKNALGKQIKQTTTSNLGIGNTKSQLVTENMFPTTLMYVSCMDLFTIYQSTNLIVYRIPTYGINDMSYVFSGWPLVGFSFIP